MDRSDESLAHWNFLRFDEEKILHTRHRIPLKNRSIISCTARFIIANETATSLSITRMLRGTRGGFSIRHTLSLLFDKLLSSR
jgi:hypothetical protein